MYGYTGKGLWVDLSSGTISKWPTPSDWMAKYVGGEGFGAKILLDNLPAKTDPFAPNNLLVLATGPLTGTKAPTSGRLVLVFKSPLTGTIGASNVGGHFAPYLKRAGFDFVAIRGRSAKPVYLCITDDTVELRDASALWGKDPEETQTRIRQELANDKVQVASIGQSGELLSRVAAVMTDIHRAAGRGGAGAVMGSKNLKAIAVHSTEKLPGLANLESFDLAVKDAIDELLNEPFVRDEMIPYGTPSFFDAMNGLGLVPAYNWQRTTTDFNSTLGYRNYHEKLEVSANRCYNCPIGCGRHTRIPEGKYAGLESGGPEYETLAAFGQKLGSRDLYAVTAANYYANKYGLDTIGTGQIIATAMEWYEKGLIDREFTDGLDLTWGNADAVVTLVKRMGKREGEFATLLGEGSLRAAETVGGEAMKYVMHVKGMEMAADGVRASKGEALSHMISPRGADHLRPYGPTIDCFGYLNDEFGVLEAKDPLKEEDKAWVKSFEELSMATNLLGTCLFASITLAIRGRTWARLLSEATGFKYTYQDLFLASERVLNIQRLFNLREGFTRDDDRLPERFRTEPAPDGPGKGQVVNDQLLLDEIYRAKGWDSQGIPTIETLARLDLAQYAPLILK